MKRNPKMTNPDRKSRWGLAIQALIAVLTALSGFFAGCQMAG